MPYIHALDVYKSFVDGVVDDYRLVCLIFEHYVITDNKLSTCVMYGNVTYSTEENSRRF